MRSPRRQCRNGCYRKICASCQTVCPCRKLPTDWCVPDAVAIEVGRPDKVRVLLRNKDLVEIVNLGTPKVVRHVDVSKLVQAL